MTLDPAPPASDAALETAGPVAGGGRCGVAVVEEQFEILLVGLRLLGDRDRIRLANRFEQRLAAERLLAVARRTGCPTDARSARKRARAVADTAGGSAGRSGSAAERDARRAAAMAANPNLADKVADGSIPVDGIDAAMKGADEESGAIPDEMIQAVAGAPPDQARRAVEDLLAARTTAEQANEHYAAQMRARRVRRYTTPADGGDPEMAGLGIEGPDAVIDELWNLLYGDADAAYQANGGRDRPDAEHVPLSHRRFDAAMNRLRRQSPLGNGRSGGGRPSVVITVGLADLTSNDSNTATATAPGHGGSGRRAAMAAGSGPIGDALLVDYLADAEVSILITGLAGQPLWLGRSRRHASDAQFLALVVRDHGYVLCGAGYHRCQAHHLTPWNASNCGSTDLDNLALVCGPCHRRLHQTNHTLTPNRGSGHQTIWTTRPATPNEHVQHRPPRPTNHRTNRAPPRSSTR